MKNKKKLDDQPKKIEKGLIKKNNTIQTQEKFEKQGSIKKQSKIKKTWQALNP